MIWCWRSGRGLGLVQVQVVALQFGPLALAGCEGIGDNMGIRVGTAEMGEANEQRGMVPRNREPMGELDRTLSLMDGGKANKPAFFRQTIGPGEDVS